VLALLPTSDALAFPQVSTRLTNGVSFVPESGAREGAPFAYSMGVVTDVLLGPRLPDRFRIGPTLDLRTRGFRTFEPTAFVTAAVPTLSGFPLTVGLGAGPALRLDGANGLQACGRIAWGFRPFDYYAYGYGLQVFVDARRGVFGFDRWDVTAGIEIDLEWLVFAPAMFVWNYIRGTPAEEEVP
jgi:hypothetical protein